jgi:hypothetical protein
VLADTNNLSERWKRLPAPPMIGPEPTTTGLRMCRWRGQNQGAVTAPCAAAVFPPRLSPLRSSRCLEECYAQSTWPESHPKCRFRVKVVRSVQSESPDPQGIRRHAARTLSHSPTAAAVSAHAARGPLAPLPGER